MPGTQGPREWLFLGVLVKELTAPGAVPVTRKAIAIPITACAAWPMCSENCDSSFVSFAFIAFTSSTDRFRSA